MPPFPQDNPQDTSQVQPPKPVGQLRPLFPQGQPSGQPAAPIDPKQAMPGLAKEYGLDPDLVGRIIHQESGWNPKAVNPESGAAGLMQLMPETAKKWGVTDPHDPIANMRGGMQEFKAALDASGGDVGEALKAYGGFKTKDPTDYINAITQGWTPKPMGKLRPLNPTAAQPQAPAQPGGHGILDMLHAHMQMNPLFNPKGAWESLKQGKQAVTAPGTMLGGPTEQQKAQQQLPAAQQVEQSNQQVQQGLQQFQAHPLQGILSALNPFGGDITPGGVSGHGILPQAPIVDPHQITHAQGAFGQGVEAAIGGLTSPEGISQLLTLPQGEVMQLYYTGQMGADTAQSVLQAQQQYQAGDIEGAKRTLGAAAVSGGMTGLVGSHLVRGARETAAPTGREVKPETPSTVPGIPPRVQAGPQAAPSVAQEGAIRPATAAGQTGAREVSGAQPRAVGSAPIEGAGIPAGTGAPATGEQRIQDRRGPAVKLPAEIERRKLDDRRSLVDIAKEQMVSTPPGVPTPGEELSKQVRQARAGAPSTVSEGEAMMSIMRDPAKYEQFRNADKKTQQQMLIAAGRSMQGAQRPTGVPETQTTPTAQRAPEPVRAAGPTEAGPSAAREPVRPGAEPVREPKPVGKLRPYTPLPPEQRPRVSALDMRRNAQVDAGKQQLANRNIDPVELGRQHGLVYDGYAGGVHSFRDTKVGGGVSLTDAKFTPEALQAAAEKHRAEIKPEDLSGMLQAKRERAAAELGPTPEERKPTEVAPGVPATPRPKAGSAEQVESWKETRRAEAAARDEALKAEAPYKPKIETRSPVGAALDRYLKPPGEYKGDRGAELVSAVAEVKKQGPEAVKKASEEMSARAQRASAMAEWGQAQLDPERAEFNKEAAAKLHAGYLKGGVDPETGKFVPEPSGRWLTEKGTKGGKPAPSWTRSATADEAEALNRVRGNKLKEVGEPREMSAEERTQLKEWETRRDELVQELRQRGQKVSERAMDQLKTYITGIQALKGTRFIHEGGPEVQVGAEGGLQDTGTRSTQAMWNRFMGKPEGAHFGKPDAETVQARINEWKKEAKWAGDISKDLGAPVEAPKPTATETKTEPAKEAAPPRATPPTAPERATTGLPMSEVERIAELKAKERAGTPAERIQAEKILKKPHVVEKPVEKPTVAKPAEVPKPVEKPVEAKPTPVRPSEPAPRAAEAAPRHSAVQEGREVGSLNKAEMGRRRMSDIAKDISRMSEGEDRENLSKRHADIVKRLDATKEEDGQDGLNTRIAKMNKWIWQMRKKAGPGLETRKFEYTEGGMTRSTTIADLEFKVMKLGQERAKIFGEEIPSLEATVKALSRPALEGAPKPMETKTEPTKMPVYGPRQPKISPETGKQVGYEAPKIGEKVVTPSPAPVEEGMQAKIDELQNQRKRLADLINAGYGDTAKGLQLRKGIKRIENAIGFKAPDAPPGVKETIEGASLLRAAKKTEPSKIESEPGVFAPETIKADHAGDLHELLTAGNLNTPLMDKALSTDAKGKRLLGEIEGDSLAKPILDDFKAGDLTANDAAHRFQRALETLLQGRQKASKLEEGKASAMAKAFSDAISIAKGRRITLPPLKEGGFIGKPGGKGMEAAKRIREQLTAGRIDDRVRKAQEVAKTEKETFRGKMDEVKAVSQAFVDWYKHPERGQKLSEALKGQKPALAFKEALGGYSEARQQAKYSLHNLISAIKDQVPHPEIREAITNYIQAGGDTDLLEQRAQDHVSKKLAVGYENAAKLTPEEVRMANAIQSRFDDLLSEGRKMGVLEHGIENYITQIWDKDSSAARGLLSDVQSGKFQTNFKYARQRLIDSYFEGEMQGKTPKNKDAAYLLATYENSMQEAIAARKFVKDMFAATAPDGRPLIVPEQRSGRAFRGLSGDVEGYTIPLHGKGKGRLLDADLARQLGIPVNERTLTENDKIRTETGDYKSINHPAFRKWAFSMEGPDGKPVLAQADARVHPDIAKHLENIYTQSWFRQFAPTRWFMQGQAVLKNVLLGFPGFHYVQEGLHASFHKVNPLHPDLVSGKRLSEAMKDETVSELMKNGLMLYDNDAVKSFGEGLAGLSKTPVIGKHIQAMQEHLFKTYIPGLKATLAKKAFARNLDRYSDYLSAGEVSRQQLAEISAAQANAAFGELNYDWMGRSKTAQDMFRIFALAPDFLEARGRFVGQALRPYGREQFMALAIRAGIYQWLIARTLNMALNQGNPLLDKDHLFSIKMGDRDYSMRTIAGDMSHLIKDPTGFFLYRMSPAFRLGAAAFSKYFRGKGLPFSDVVSTGVPIPVQGAARELFKKGQGNQEYLNSLLESIGVQSKKYMSPKEREAMEEREEKRLQYLRGEKPEKSGLGSMPRFSRVK